MYTGLFDFFVKNKFNNQVTIVYVASYSYMLLSKQKLA